MVHARGKYHLKGLQEAIRDAERALARKEGHPKGLWRVNGKARNTYNKELRELRIACLLLKCLDMVRGFKKALLSFQMMWPPVQQILEGLGAQGQGLRGQMGPQFIR